MVNKTGVIEVIEFRKMRILLLVASLYLLEVCKGGKPHKVKQKQHFLIEVNAKDDNGIGKSRRQKSPKEVTKIGDYHIPWLNECQPVGPVGHRQVGTKRCYRLNLKKNREGRSSSKFEVVEVGLTLRAVVDASPYIR